jgi:uncharacterized membrane protein YraQ (UPF0718 family)
MKVKIDIILGFLGSGKTTLINSMLKSNKLKDEVIVIVQQEIGEVKVSDSKSIIVKKKNSELVDINLINSIISNFEPDRIIIELNGMDSGNELINSLYRNKNCKIHKIITTIDMKKASMYFLNISGQIREHILNSDIIVLNNSSGMKKKQITSIKKNITGVNELSKKYCFETIKAEEKAFLKNKVDIMQESSDNNGFYIIFSLCLVLLLSMIFACYMGIVKLELSTSYLIEFNRIFMGIFIETVPFIIVGGFISAIIQIFISEDAIARIFPKNTFLSCIVASVIGIIFPICDCGTIPVARGFLKKGLPLSVAVTFMLAAPIVNPIAIISTIYAFSDMPQVVIYRLAIGMTIAISVGLIMSRYSSKDVVSENIINCQCELCSGEYVNTKNIFTKIKGVFLLAGDEFITVGKYMILGAFFSSIMQVLLSQNIVDFTSQNKIMSLLIMMVFAFVFSVCSTSDAFIGKSFLNSFPLGSVMGFLVVGPMVDIKNTMMLLGSFKKSFVLKLLSCISIISFILLAVIFL